MNWAHKNILWFLLIIPPGLIAFYWWSWRKHAVLMTQFIQARLLPTLTIGISPGRKKFKFACLAAAVTFLILALARPQWGFAWEEVKQKGLDIVVAIDVSKSMLAEDIAPNRLARAKLSALDLMQQAKSDRLGLVAFAGSAFLQCPLTIDDSAFRQSVEALDVNVIPEGGTALAEAIQTAEGAFKEGENHRVLVIFTDGEDQDSGAVEAAKKAGEHGLRIFTMGVGSADGEILRVKDAKGRSDYVRDDQGNVVKSHLNEGLLREIAEATEGFYFPVRGAQAVDTLYKQCLAPLPKSESGEKLVRRYYERYHWPLGLAIVFLIVELLIPERKRVRRSSPEPREAAGVDRKKQPAAAIALLVICLAAPGGALGSPSSALREYKNGNYQEAFKEYDKLLQKKKEDTRLHFNAGAAAYKNQQFEEAEKHFNEALNSPDLKLLQEAYYNRGNSLFNLGARAEKLEDRKKSWENALKDFESALQLSKQDADAKHNYDFVKQQLEELKQQQQQQQNKDDKDQKDDQKQDQKQDQQNQQSKDDKDKQDKSKEDQQKQDQQKQDQKKQPDQKDKDKQQQQASNEQKDQQDKQQQQEKNKKDEQEKQQKANPSKDGKKPEDKGDQDQQQSYAVGQMTPQQAQQLLDAQKNEEMLLPVKPEGKAKPAGRKLRDW